MNRKKTKKREMTRKELLKWALMAMTLCRNGLMNRRGLKETRNVHTCDTELWNLRAARRSIEEAMSR